MNDHECLGFEVEVKQDEDVILVRQRVRSLAQLMRFGVLDQTRLVTAVSELARNMVVHAKGGRVFVSTQKPRLGLKITFTDHGPGISNIEAAMQPGFSTTGTLGLGLKGAKRLVDDFVIYSTPADGTTVVITKWL